MRGSTILIEGERARMLLDIKEDVIDLGEELEKLLQREKDRNSEWYFSPESFLVQTMKEYAASTMMGWRKAECIQLGNCSTGRWNCIYARACGRGNR